MSKSLGERASQLLEVLEPLAESVHAVPPKVVASEMVCVPEGEDIKRYLEMLRWHLGVDEELRGVAIVEEVPADDRVQGFALISEGWGTEASGPGARQGSLGKRKGRQRKRWDC